MLFGWQLGQDPEIWPVYESPTPKRLVDSSVINIAEASLYAILPIFIIVSYKMKYSEVRLESMVR